MDHLTRDCHQALQAYNGHQLAATISPVAPRRFLNRLESIYHSSNSASIQRDVSHALATNARRGLSQEDRQILDTWSEIYVAYWHAVAALVAQEEQQYEDWGKVYDTWKDVVNAVIRGYSTGTLENWTLPVLYLAGKHLRIFAIKADESKKGAEGSTAIDMGGIQDDIAGDFGKNIKLEDAARVLNRMFTLCISDRYVACNPMCILSKRVIERQWKSPANGASTTSPTFSSKPTSSSIPSAYPKTSCEQSTPQTQTCLIYLNFQNRILLHSNTILA